MSVRRFCAVEDELWDNVPSRAPNSLCPRLRSSTCPLFRRSAAVRSIDVVVELGAGSAFSGLLLLLSLWLSRGRLECSFENEDWRRFRLGDVVLGGSAGSSGSMTAEATIL